MSTLSRLALTLAAAAALMACGKSADKCPDINVQDGCKLRCARTEASGGATKVCGKSLMLTRTGTNDILQKESKQIQFRTLTQESCFEIVPPAEGQHGASLAKDADQSELARLCGPPPEPNAGSQPAQ